MAQGMSRSWATTLAFRNCVKGNDLDPNSMVSRCSTIAHHSEALPDFTKRIKAILKDKTELSEQTIEMVDYEELWDDLRKYA